jgi:hypothetical protein
MGVRCRQSAERELSEPIAAHGWQLDVYNQFVFGNCVHRVNRAKVALDLVLVHVLMQKMRLAEIQLGRLLSDPSWFVNEMPFEQATVHSLQLECHADNQSSPAFNTYAYTM